MSWRPPRAVLERLGAHCEVVTAPDDTILTPAALRRGAVGAFGLLTTLRDVVDRGLLDAAPGLRIVANCAAGFDNIDVVAARRRGVWVSHTPDVLTETTAELAFGLMLALSRRLCEGDRLVRAGGFQGWHPRLLLGRDLRAKTVGIIGMGRIGRALARRALAFGMRVLYQGGRADDPRCEALELDELLGAADFISLHVPLTDATRGLIDEAALARMRPTAYLINTARGAVVDSDALVRALTTGRLAGAALDVFPGSPERPDPRLFGFDNVVLTPHIGSASFETRRAMAELAVDNLIAALAGERPPNLVAG